MSSSRKLQDLRKALEAHSLAAFLQPVGDEYMSEYPPACAKRVEWLTGFSGSAGMAVTLRDKAALFIDGRYTLQAKNETDAKLYEQYNSGEIAPEGWLAKNLKKGDRVGYDAKLHTQGAVRRMSAALEPKGVALVPVPNLVDAIWKNRPAAPASKVFIHDLKYAGENSASKRKRIARAMKEAGADICVLSAPDSVNWLLNIRGSDVENTPLALAPALIDSKGAVRFYIEASRVSAAVRKHLSGVTLCDPASLEADLKALKNRRVWCDPNSASSWYAQTLKKAGAELIEKPDPCLLPKAIKNPVEFKNIRAAHIRDGAAVAKLLCWLDFEAPKRKLMESEISAKLLAFRAAQKDFREPSFTTIAGSGPHGAIVHYRVTKESDRALKQGELLLLDSGGQYPEGTTDITRTVPIGKPAAEHKDRFTRVLKGHIAIALARFPAGTAGSQLDALARQYLWEAGLDYDHGTGHGVGQFLSVHEGPQRISKRGGDAALKPGMIISNEPGYYKAGAYGIRIENLVAVVEAEKNYLAFDTVTCAPIDTRLVDGSMMNAKEKKWLNDYHSWVLKSLSPALTASERAWLKARCAPV